MEETYNIKIVRRNRKYKVLELKQVRDFVVEEEALLFSIKESNIPKYIKKFLRQNKNRYCSEEIVLIVNDKFIFKGIFKVDSVDTRSMIQQKRNDLFYITFKIKKEVEVRNIENFCKTRKEMILSLIESGLKEEKEYFSEEEYKQILKEEYRVFDFKNYSNDLNVLMAIRANAFDYRWT